MTRLLTPGRALGAGLLVVIVVAGVLWLTPSGSYLLLPDPAHPVDPLVSVPSAKRHHLRTGGGIYFVDLVERKASLLERLFPGIHDGATLVPASALTPPGVSDRARHQEGVRDMTRSQSIAAAVALRALGYKVVAKPAGVLISAVFDRSPAAGRLEPTEVIVGVDGKPVRTLADLRRAMRRHSPGDAVALKVRNGAGIQDVQLRTVADPDRPGKPIIGVLIQQAANIHLPLNVRIDSGGVVGPSAGLAFALEVMEELGRNVDHGYKVAATGELQLDGSVGPIGGVHQKIFGVRESKVEVFLVPAGDNAREARRHAQGVRVIPVKTFPQALQALATLPPKS